MGVRLVGGRSRTLCIDYATRVAVVVDELGVYIVRGMSVERFIPHQAVRSVDINRGAVELRDGGELRLPCRTGPREEARAEVVQQ